MLNDEESPEDDEEAPLLENEEVEGLQDENRGEDAETPGRQGQGIPVPSPQLPRIMIVRRNGSRRMGVLEMEFCIHKASLQLTTSTWNEETGSTRT